MKRSFALLTAVLVVAAGLTALTSWRHGPEAMASSHREAPLIAYDPQADNTDVYAFVSPDRPDTVTIIANYIPLGVPEGGPNFYTFGDDVSYRIHIDNDGDAHEDITYEFRFQTEVQNQNTFLFTTGPVMSLDDPNLNVRQTWTLTRMDGRGNGTVIGQGPVAPPNIGVNSFPNYDQVANQAITDIGSGITVFAGQRDDPFWVDLRVFDLLKPASAPHDSLAGANVDTIAIQVPITSLTRDGSRPADPNAADAVIGVWATAWRQSTKVFQEGGWQANNGQWVQVSRLGNPLVNEVVIPRGLKDRFNAVPPSDDAEFLTYVTDPELATLLNAVAGFPAPQHNRTDLVSVFLTGVQGLNMPPNVTPAEELRLNVAIPPSPNPNRLGVLGGDNAGFPNGRRLTDDVVDIALQAVGGILMHVPGAEQLSQGVPANDKPFLPAFPYVASPWPGNK